MNRDDRSDRAAGCVTLHNVPVLSAPQSQQCVKNSTQAKGDEPLSHILSDIPVLSENGTSTR